MIYPPQLNSGDKVKIVAPAGRIEAKDLDKPIKILKSWGLDVEVGRHVHDDYGYFSSSDMGRLEDFQNAIDDFEVKAIFCARGGYGTGKIIDKLDFGRFMESPKWIIGFSDITILHLKLHSIQVASLHGPVARQIATTVDDESVEILRKLLFDTSEVSYNIPANGLNFEGRSIAQTVGGNLSIICNSIGTSCDIDLDGKILFLEEIDEKLYAFDRYFNQLYRSGKLENLTGIIVGQLTNIIGKDPSYGKTVFEIVREYIQPHKVPLCFGMESGHEHKNLTIPISFNCDLNVKAGGTTIRFFRD
jgi:muramoyltetrapeptide carboxypeptidase